MKRRISLRGLIRFLAAAACLAALAATVPAAAAKTPARVGLVTFTSASLNAGQAALTLTWPEAKRAKKYQVLMGASYDKVKTVKKTVKKTRVTIRGLAPGKTYFFTVRGVNGRSIGPSSARVGRTTIAAMDTSPAPSYRVMTYNVCSEVAACHAKWPLKKRLPAIQDRVAAHRPDVLALQEAISLIRLDRDADPATSRMESTLFPGYVLAVEAKSKALYFRDDRFVVAVDAAGASAGSPRTGQVMMRAGKYAVWAELADRRTSNGTIFWSVHTVAGKTETAAKQRRTEIKTLLAHAETINRSRLPSVYAGDFNSHKNRSNDHVAQVFKHAGYHDAFDLATTVVGQHFNSYSGYRVRPVTSITWGDHVDHVWVDPTSSWVTKWEQGGRQLLGRYVKPMGSDHQPIVVDVRVVHPT